MKKENLDKIKVKQPITTNGNLRIPNSVHKRFLSYEH